MTNLMTKSSLYDMLSMIIPGFIMLFSIEQIVGCDADATETFSSSDGLAIPKYVCIFVLSYVVGLLIHYLSKKIFDRFLRNTPEHIRKAKEIFDKKRVEREEKENADAMILDDYYINYYNVIQKSSVPAMEAQLSFLRSMVIVTFVGCAAICSKVNACGCEKIFALSPCLVILVLMVLVILSIWHMFHIQKKICFQIFEDSYYLDKVKEKDRKLGEITKKKNEAENSENEQINT